ncbi:MAG TPA: DMP19 family protein [Gemmatimonadaceae bacterium]
MALPPLPQPPGIVTLTAFPPGAFTSEAAASPSALVARLEHEVMQRVIRAAEEAAQAAVGELNALGHRFAAEPDAPLCFASALPDGRTLRLEVSVVGGTSLRVLAPGELPPEFTPTPGEARFYQALAHAQEREARDGYAALTDDERVVLCLGEMEAEVNNGGWEQYFLNSSGDHAHDTLRALQAVGATVAAEILQSAMKVFGKGGPPADRGAREALLGGLTAKQRATLDRLSSRYYAQAEPIADIAGSSLGIGLLPPP